MPKKTPHKHAPDPKLAPIIRRLPPSPEPVLNISNEPKEHSQILPNTISNQIVPTGKKEEPTTWYTEKNRMSITHIQVPRDDTTEYFLRDGAINEAILTGILVALIIFLAGAFF